MEGDAWMEADVGSRDTVGSRRMETEGSDKKRKEGHKLSGMNIKQTPLWVDKG